MNKKNNWQEFKAVLDQHGIKKLYHFTDRDNLESIIQSGGLYSWADCEEKSITIAKPGGGEVSRGLDRRDSLQHYVRVSFVSTHPMMYAAMNDGRISNPVILEIDPEVIYWKETRYADRNATRNGANVGDSLDNFKAIHFNSVKARNQFDLDDDEQMFFQAEVLVKHFIPLSAITNIGSFGYTIPSPTPQPQAKPDTVFTLKRLQPVLDSDGNPIMLSGSSAVVYKMTDGEKDYAIKCFTQEQEGREEAYRMIAEELEYVSTSFLSPIQYSEKEQFVGTENGSEKEFAVLQMNWIEGVTLDNYVCENLHDTYALENLAYQFCRMAQWLLTQPFAHGDLQPNNILVQADGSLVLVDYDGMFVSAMKGQKARELGNPNYRHPLRTEEQFDEHIDDFALACIALSLKAIALKPGLHTEFGSADRLLFSEADFQDLGQSKLIAALQPLMSDTDFFKLYGLFLIAYSQQSLSNVSFRLFSVSKPEKPVVVVEEVLSTEVTDEDLANAWVDEFGVKYSQDKKRLLEVPWSIREYSIIPGTKVICDKAFPYGNYQKSIIIPNSVISIGDGVFSRSNLRIRFKVNKSKFYSDGHCLIDRASHRLISCHRHGLENYTIPNSVTSIGNEAFSGSDLQSINIPNSVTSIGDYSFSDCHSLQSINIPNSVTSIGNGGFCGCNELEIINIPNSVTSIGNSAFDDCHSLQSINIPNSVTSIGNSAFFNCYSLQSINIPNSVTSIGDRAFFACESLQKITIPDSVTSIGNKAFAYCKSLQNIIIPNSVTSIGNYAFYECSSLQSIYIPNSVTSIGKSAFSKCDSLQSITIPNSVTSIGEKAFYACESLRNISIPNSVTNIRDEVFSHCYSLQNIYIPVNSRAKFEKLLPEYKDKLVELDN